MQSTSFATNLPKNPFIAIREENNVKPHNNEEPSSHLFKRFKALADEGNDENDFTGFKDQAELVKPMKKKLFNLDMNYFVKQCKINTRDSFKI